MAVADSINALYLSILGRPADAPGLANAVAAVGNGATLAQVAAGLASSPEGQAIIGVFYQVELGRAPDPGGLAGATSYLASGGTLSGLRSGLGTSAEAQSDVTAIFQGELGRALNQPDLANLEHFLAAGGSLAAVRMSIAMSPEAQGDLNNLYQTILGRAPDSGGLAYFTQLLANGESQASIKTALVDSPEVVNDISSVYQSRLGHAPNAAELAAGQSELSSGIPSGILQDELNGLPTSASFHTTGIENVQITPQTIGGSAPNLVYSLLGNDALIASQPADVSVGYGGTSSAARISGFNTASDIIQIQQFETTQSPQFGPSNLSTIQVPTSNGGTASIPVLQEPAYRNTPSYTNIYLGSETISLQDVSVASLTAANFRLV